MQPRIRLKQKPPAEVRLNAWVKVSRGEYRCGNCAVRCVSFEMIGDYRSESWGIFVKVGRRWKRVWPAQRPWNHGSAGQAKIGAAHLSRMQR